jgi:hypothetical protein
MSEHQKSLLDHIADHPKVAAILALLAFAASFSPRVSVMALWICLFTAWLFAAAMILGIPKLRRNERRIIWTSLLILIIGAILFAYGWWLRGSSNPPVPSTASIPLVPSPHLRAVDVMLVLPQDKKQPIIVIGKHLNFSVIVNNDGASGTLQFTSGSVASDHLISEASRQEAESFFYGMLTKGFDDPTIMKPVMDFDAGETESWMLTGATGVTEQQFRYLNDGGILYFAGKGRYLGRPDLKPFELCFYWPHGLNHGSAKCETHNTP